MKVKVTKVTNKQLADDACSMTIFGKGGPSLKKLYASEHSPIRTQTFKVELFNIPLFVSTHLLRHKIGSEPFALSYRPDRNKKSKVLKDYTQELRTLTNILVNGDINKNEFIIKQEEILNEIETKTDRYTPTNLMLYVNVQALINMARVRLCNKASNETVVAFKKIKECIKIVDPDLYHFLVRNCVYRNGICPEFKPCGYNKTEIFQDELKDYQKLFNYKQ